MTLSSLIHAGLIGLALVCGLRFAGGSVRRPSVLVATRTPEPPVFVEPEDPFPDPPEVEVLPEEPFEEALPDPEWTEVDPPRRVEDPRPDREFPDLGPGFYLDPFLRAVPDPRKVAEPEPESLAPPISTEATSSKETTSGPPATESVLLESPSPHYPRASVRRGEEGRVLCRMYIDASGRVVRVDVLESSGYPRLDEAARDGLLRWRFRPRTEGGRAVADVLDHPVEFRIE